VPVSYAQKRFAIRMHDEVDATLDMTAGSEVSGVAVSTQKIGVAVSTQNIDMLRTPLAQKRFAIRMREEEHTVCLGGPGQPLYRPLASAPSCEAHGSPAPCMQCMQQERQVTPDTESPPWPQRRFQIRLQDAGLADEGYQGYQQTETPQLRQQQEDQKASPTSFSQQRFATRMHNELGTDVRISAVARPRCAR